MWKNNLVIDAVGHTYDFSVDNRRPNVPVEGYDGFIAWLYGYGHTAAGVDEGRLPALARRVPRGLDDRGAADDVLRRE